MLAATVQPTVVLDEDDSPDTDASACLREDVISTCPKVLSISAEEACLPVECVKLAMLQQIFHKAEFLLNEEGAIREAASNDPRYRTVKSKDGRVPLHVRPVNKKTNLFSCECSTFKGIGLCADTVAVAETQGLLFQYLSDLHTSKRKEKVHSWCEHHGSNRIKFEDFRERSKA